MQITAEEKPKNDELPFKDPVIEALFAAGAHIGYSKSRRHPKMQEYVFCVRNDVEIFNLERTEAGIKSAEEYLESLGKEGKNVIWVGAKAPAKNQIKEAGTKLGHPYVAERWLGGTFTNFSMLEERLKHLENLEREFETGEFKKYVKKERLTKTAEMNKLKKMFEGLRALKSIPAAMVVVDPKEEDTAFSEALKKGVNVVALLNSDCSPDGIKYPIPANDNSKSVIELIVKRLVSAYENGVKQKKEISSKEKEGETSVK